MIIANINPGETYARIRGLWQYDYGQVLRIQGLSLPPAIEIHFSLQETGGEADPRVGITKDGVTDVVIPDFILEGSGAIEDYFAYAFIYLSDENSGQTEHRIEIGVKSRPKPEGYKGSGDDTMGAIMKAVNEIAAGKIDAPIPAKVGQVVAVKSVDGDGKPTEFEAVDQGGGIPDEKIAEAVDAYLTANPLEEKDPTVPDWAKSPKKPIYTAAEVGALPDSTKIPSSPGDVGADPAGTAESKVSAHNTSVDAHNDIRLLIEGLTSRLNALADSDDTTLDQMSEIVAYIKSNKSLIDAITTGKISTSDIVDNLTTNTANRPLSAAQGVVLKAMIDGIAIPSNTSDLTNDSGFVELDDSLTDNTKAAPAGMVGELKSEIDQLKQAGTGSGSGVTVAQSNSLWAIIQKAAFAEALTDEELNDFKTAWGITTENIPATGITLDKSTLSFTDSASQTLVATVEPSDTTDKVVWTSNAESVATVANGVVKPVSNGSATITATCGSVLATCSVTVDMAGEEQVTLTSISATYTGGEVAVGTALTALTGITVTGTYSDGSTATITGYTLSGTIVEGSNTITVSYGGKTTTVTVTGVVESGGQEADPLYAFESVENAEITSRNGNYTGTVTVSVGNHVRVKAPGNEWFWNINASTAKTHGMVGNVYDTHITDTLFVIPAGATVKMYTKYKINEGTFSNLNVKLDSTQDFTTEVAPAIGTKIGWPSNSMTNTIDEKEVEFTLDEETSVSCIAVDVFPYDTSVDSVIELDIELYVNGERWI